MISYKITAFVGLFCLAQTSFATVMFESDGTLERNPFPYIITNQEEFVTDEAEDIVVFDEKNRTELPGNSVDLLSMNIQKDEDAWAVTFTIYEPLAEDPGAPINFDIFFDRDNDTSNNATSGVYRVGADSIAMILFGTATKWHSKLWYYEPNSHRFIEQNIPIAYTIGTTEFTIFIPYSVLPKDAKVPMRGFSLSHENKITAIDVIPGVGLPVVLGTMNSSTTSTPSNEVNAVPDIEEATPPNVSFKNGILIAVAMMIVAAIAIIVSPFDFKSQSRQ